MWRSESAPGTTFDNDLVLDKYLSNMSTISHSYAREKLAQTMDRVCDDHEPVVITRQKQRSVVIMSLEDFQALEETAYLLKSPANARRLLAIPELRDDVRICVQRETLTLVAGLDSAGVVRRLERA